jgi:tetratricopeptide (TPR) repeat protein
MPAGRATLPHPTRDGFYRTAMAAAGLLALTASAFSQPNSQAKTQNSVVLNTLQPHSVRTSLRSYEETEQAKLPSAAPSQDKSQGPLQGTSQAKPRDICLVKMSSAAASIAACTTYIQAAGRRWDGLAPAFGRRAEAYRAQGDIDAAIADFDRALKIEPKKIDNLLGRGLIYFEKRDTDRAIRDFSQIINLDPRHAGAIRYRAQARRAAGDLKRAALDYDLLARINPKDSQTYYQLGLVHRELKAFGPALEDFGRMVQIDGDALAHYGRGLVFYDMRQYDRAIGELDRAINVNPGYPMAFNIRGLAYAAIGETRRSIQDFDQAIELDGSFAQAFINRGNIYQSTRKYDRALADYSVALKLDPKDAYSLYSRGLTMRALGHEEAATMDIAKAKEIEPGIGP